MLIQVSLSMLQRLVILFLGSWLSVIHCQDRGVYYDTTPRTWQQSSVNCQQLGAKDRGKFSITGLRVPHRPPGYRPDQFFWIGAKVQQTPWLTILGCFETSSATTQKDITNDADPTYTCYMFCFGSGSLTAMGISEKTCYCYDNVNNHRKNNEQCVYETFSNKPEELYGAPNPGSVVVLAKNQQSPVAHSNDFGNCASVRNVGTLPVKHQFCSCLNRIGTMCADGQMSTEELPLKEAVKKCSLKTDLNGNYNGLTESINLQAFWTGFYRGSQEKWASPTVSRYKRSNPMTDYCVAVKVNGDGTIFQITYPQICTKTYPSICEKLTTVNVCDHNDCQNGGTCVADQASVGGYRCICVTGYVGGKCEENEGSLGKEFIFLIMGNIPPAVQSSSIFITTDTVATVDISTADTLPTNLKSSIDQQTDVDPSVRIALPPGLQCSSYVKEPKVVLIRSTEPISVQITSNDFAFSTDTTTVFPTKKLSKSYIISSYSTIFSQFAIAASEDDTIVNIFLRLSGGRTISIMGKIYRNLDTLEISLKKLENFQFRTSGSDFSGTRIESNKPVAVFSGNQCLDTGPGACSYAVEQIPPISRLGETFIVPPNLRRPQTLVRILSPTKTSMTVSTEGQTQNLDVNENVPTDIFSTDEQVVVIESKNPILVTSIAFGSPNSAFGDPYMTIVPGKSQYLDRYKVFVPPGYQKNYVAIMIQTKAKATIALNGQPIELNNIRLDKQQTINSIDFTTLVVEVGSGELLVTSDEAPFGLMVYGQRRNDGYGFAGNVLNP